MDTIRVVTADDHPLVLAGVRATLADQDAFQIVAEARNGDAAWDACREHRPDILLLDLDMPGLATEQLLGRLEQEPAPPKVVILTAREGPEVFQKVKSRVQGYLLKEEVGPELAYALRAVHLGAVWFTQKVTWQLLTNPPPDDQQLLAELTPREREVLQYIAQGLDNQTIAVRLQLAEQTVRNYASTVYEKLGFRSRTEAVVWARDHHLL